MQDNNLNQKKLCLILDNPGRDLLGMGLLAYQLALRGVQVAVIPMYDQLAHVTRERPDLVVVNYARKANRRLLERYKKLGVRVVVLDTEGGILRSEYRELLNIVLESGAVHAIDDYFLWGNRQYQAFHQQFGASKPHLHLTGCPRFDLYSTEWNSLIPDPPSQDGVYVLFATSFPLNNPRFATPTQEVLNVQETMGLDKQAMRTAMQAANQALAGFLSLVRTSCSRFLDVQFVLRPHPFEGEAIYTSELSDLPNLRITREGSLNAWLKHATCVVQLNSSVAFEAGLFGKPVISLEMFQDASLEVEVSSACSLKATTESDYYDLLAHLLGKDQHTSIEQQLRAVRLALEHAISDWIYAHDGRSAERASERLVTLLADCGTPRASTLGWWLMQIYEYLRFAAKVLLKSILRPRLLANSRLKEFHARDFAPLRILWQKVGVEPVDRPLGGWWPFIWSNAVLFRKEYV